MLCYVMLLFCDMPRVFMWCDVMWSIHVTLAMPSITIVALMNIPKFKWRISKARMMSYHICDVMDWCDVVMWCALGWSCDDDHDDDHMDSLVPNKKDRAEFVRELVRQLNGTPVSVMKCVWMDGLWCDDWHMNGVWYDDCFSYGIFVLKLNYVHQHVHNVHLLVIKVIMIQNER